MADVPEGETVTWKWGGGSASGTVKSLFAEMTTRKIKDSEVARNGTQDDPALHIEQADGDTVLKLASEVEKN